MARVRKNVRKSPPKAPLRSADAGGAPLPFSGGLPSSVHTTQGLVVGTKLGTVAQPSARAPGHPPLAKIAQIPSRCLLVGFLPTRKGAPRSRGTGGSKRGPSQRLGASKNIFNRTTYCAPNLANFCGTAKSPQARTARARAGQESVSARGQLRFLSWQCRVVHERFAPRERVLVKPGTRDSQSRALLRLGRVWPKPTRTPRHSQGCRAQAQVEARFERALSDLALEWCVLLGRGDHGACKGPARSTQGGAHCIHCAGRAWISWRVASSCAELPGPPLFHRPARRNPFRHQLW